MMGRGITDRRRRARSRLLAEYPRCHWCGRPLTEADATLDHRVPESRGGGEGDNLVLACRPCNAAKGDRTPEEYRRALERGEVSPRGRVRARRDAGSVTPEQAMRWVWAGRAAKS